MQAITTKFLPATNTRGSRIRASAQDGSVTVGYNHALGSDPNHDEAAKALIAKLGWGGKWVRGALPDGKGNAYVCRARPTKRAEISGTEL